MNNTKLFSLVILVNKDCFINIFHSSSAISFPFSRFKNEVNLYININLLKTLVYLYLFKSKHTVNEFKYNTF